MVKSQPILRYILRGIPAIAVAVLLSACSTTNTAKNMHPETRAVVNDNSSLQASQDELKIWYVMSTLNRELWISMLTGKAYVIVLAAAPKKVSTALVLYSVHSASSLA